MKSVCNIFLIAFVWIRVAAGLLAFAVANAFVAAAIAAAYLLFFWSKPLRQKAIAAALGDALKFVFLGVVRLLGGYDLNVEKPKRLPEAAIYTANHISLFDALILLAIIPNAGVVIKRKYSGILSIWLLVKTFDFIVVDSDAPNATEDVIVCARRALAQKRSILIFPEGRRSKVGRVLEFKKSAFKLAFETGAKIVPVAIYSPRPFLPKGELSIREKTYYKIKFSAPLDPEKSASPAALRDAAYDAVARQVHAFRDREEERPPRYQLLK